MLTTDSASAWFKVPKDAGIFLLKRISHFFRTRRTIESL